MDDKAHGTGRLEHTDGASYDGQWRASMKHGQGSYVHSDGSKPLVLSSVDPLDSSQMKM